MNEIRQDDQCIERRTFMDSAVFYSVFEYDDRIRRARTLSSRKARALHDVVWTQGAPEVQELTTEWQETKEGKFRICDWDVYDAQMRRLIGLE